MFYMDLTCIITGLTWKRIHASSTTDRLQQQNQQQNRRTQEVREPPSYLPFKALPLINVWDGSYKATYHQDFEASKADGDLSWRCPLTSLTNDHYEDATVMYGIVTPDRPWLLSPPVVPVAGATQRDPNEVKVMACHGLCYSHSGLVDPGQDWTWSYRVVRNGQMVQQC